MESWWKTGVLYQIYPLSFADSNGDGFGDLRGIVSKLEHLAWLGVAGIWLSPITVSPNADWGYDVADYCAVQPEMGTLDDLDALVAAAAQRDIEVLVDFVPNHTSDRHPWFVDARSSRDAEHRDWYVWADPKPDGSPPNNWMASFGGPAWRLDEPTGQYYMHNHLAEQPDLNWWNDEVRAEFDRIVRFWFDRGIAGFRIDVCNIIVKDAELRDNPPATAADDIGAQALGQRTVYNGNRPEVHDVLRAWRGIAESYRSSPRILIGETPVDDGETLARFYGEGDELNLAFNFPFIGAPLAAEPMRAIVEEIEAQLPAGAWPAWTGSNHDMSRLASRWAGDDPQRIRAALVMLLTLRGTPVLYQGDEIGLGDIAVPQEQLRDPLGVRYWPHWTGRDPMRTPMPWAPGVNRGFTDAGVTPWLPVGDPAADVALQRDDPASILTLTRDLIALRHASPDLHAGAYASLPSPAGVWMFRRGDATTVVLNLSDDDATVDVEGRVLLATDRAREGSTLRAPIALRAWDALVVHSG
ncbi:MAG TPA: alpha-amylase family glycosyl hydrolase [Acidimicrobiia bacterium]|nr:alpha-amylase family glycosyl hydrolase [Acidimicrobiia bacterium]